MMAGHSHQILGHTERLPSYTGMGSRAGDKPGTKSHLVTEISMIRKTRCPQINYEEKERPGMFKRRLCAEDVLLGRYKHIPISASNIKEKSIIRRQKKLLSLMKKSGKPIPEALLPPEPKAEEQQTNGHRSRSPVADDANGGSDVLNEVPSDDDDGNHDDVLLKQLSARLKNGGDDVFAQGDDIDDDDDDDISEKEEGTDGFGEYVSFLDRKKRREKKLDSDDFDTDLDSLDSEEEEEQVDALGRPIPTKVNKTLQSYERACVKYQMRPNATFVRQCGKSSLDIRHRMLTFRDARPIAIALVDDRKTSFLDLSHNPLGSQGVTAIADMLLVNRTILELNLSNTNLESEGLEALAKSLSKNNTVRRLYLENNNLQPNDSIILASLLENSSSLLELHVPNNNLGFDGTKQIARVLALNKGKLNVLNLSYNNIRTDSAATLGMALKKNTILRSLDISWNGFGVDGCRALALALEANSTLRDLNLTCNRLGVKSLGFLLKGLVKNRGLHCIRVGMNPLTTDGAKTLVSAITSSKVSALTELDVRGIPLDEEFFELMAKLIQEKVIRVHYDDNVHLGTSDITRETDGTFLDNFNPVLVMYEYMKKDNLRVIDFFQFFDTRKRDKLSKSDLANGFNILMIPFTQHHVDIIMKTIDTNKDGFIALDEMTKGYTKSDKIVKKRRIKATRMKTTDEGLENLWIYLKSLIVKRKEENVKKNAAKSEARRESLLPGMRRGSMMPGSEGRRGSSMPPGSEGRRGSLMPPGSEGRRGSLNPPGSEGKRGSLIPPGSEGRRGSLIPPGSEGRRGSLMPITNTDANARRDGLMPASGGLLKIAVPEIKTGSDLPVKRDALTDSDENEPATTTPGYKHLQPEVDEAPVGRKGLNLSPSSAQRGEDRSRLLSQRRRSSRIEEGVAY